MTTWQEIYHRLDPKKPLKANDTMLEKRLYINDFYDNVQDKIILNKEKNYKFLIPGHVGCGKSTFINMLSADYEELPNVFY
jgi:GTPase SAR1 family protein